MTVLLLLVALLDIEPTTCEATWYKHGTHTCTDERFYADRVSCASHDKSKIGRFCIVSYEDKQLLVRCNDYSPRSTIDLSRGAFKYLAPLKAGRIMIQVQWL